MDETAQGVEPKKRGRKPTFKEYQNPANEHAKEVAKRDSKRKEMRKAVGYTFENDKYSMITVKENGNVYRTHIGRSHQVTKDEVAKWKKDGLWVYPHEVSDFKEKFMKSLK
jgi:hypothetical protein